MYNVQFSLSYITIETYSDKFFRCLNDNGTW